MSDLTLLRPLWLLALIPWLLWWWQARRRPPLFAPVLARYLRAPEQATPPWRPLAALLMILALSGPALPGAAPPQAAPSLDIWLLDLSRSMLATDLSPDRATRARLLLQAQLDQPQARRIALILFAADAYLVQPPSEDREALRRLLPDLRPDVMPMAGSAPERAVQLALARFADQAPARLLLVTDAITAPQRDAIRASWPCRGISLLRCRAPRLDIVLLSGDAPVRLAGEPGRPRLPAPDRAAIAALAEETGGRLITDPQTLTLTSASPLSAPPQQGWRELGPFLLLLLLPFALLARRGQLWLLLAALLPLGVPHADDAHGLLFYQEGHYRAAAEAFDDPLWRGNAWYRAGEYQRAATAYAMSQSVTAHYNRGNALARLGRLDEAIAAYLVALALDPAHADARFNLALLQRRQQQQAHSAATAPSDQPEPATAKGAPPLSAPPVILLKERLRKLAERAAPPPRGEPW